MATEPTPAPATKEVTDVEWVTLPVPPAEQGPVARALFAAADDPRQVRTVSGGFRVPYVVAKTAGQLGYLANPGEGKETAPAEEPPDLTPGPAPEPTGQPEESAAPAAEAATPDAAEAPGEAAPADVAPRPARRTRASQS
jgi:hypothetical protein